MATHFKADILYGGNGFLMDMPQGNSLDYFRFFDDFGAVDDDQTNDWTVVKDTGASVGIVADTASGELALTSAATTDNDGASIQGNEVFLPAADRTIWFATRVKCNDADQTDLMFGLSVNFATNPEAALTAADRICFQVDDGNASILCKTEASGTETSTDSGVDLADDTYVKLALRVTGTGGVTFYVNDQKVATHTTNIPATEMALAAMSLSGSATGTRATTLDYIMGAQTR